MCRACLATGSVAIWWPPSHRRAVRPQQQKAPGLCRGLCSARRNRSYLLTAILLQIRWTINRQRSLGHNQLDPGHQTAAKTRFPVSFLVGKLRREKNVEPQPWEAERIARRLSPSAQRRRGRKGEFAGRHRSGKASKMPKLDGPICTANKDWLRVPSTNGQGWRRNSATSASFPGFASKRTNNATVTIYSSFHFCDVNRV